MRRKLNPKRITDEQVKNGVKSKIAKMENELRRNPNNTLTSERLAFLKQLHKGKI